MECIQVLDWAAGPKYTTVEPPPEPDANSVRVRVVAVGQHHVVRSMASGKHYASGSLPHTPGMDGVGVDTSSGNLVYFSLMGVPGAGGSYVGIVNVPRSHVWALPSGVDPVQAAALMNPAMSSWMALKERVDFPKGSQQSPPPADWTCLIIGATSISGRLAVKIARSFGAKAVFGAARNASKLDAIDLDARIVLQDPPSSTDFNAAANVSVVLDYLYGPYPEVFLKCAARATLKQRAAQHAAPSRPLTYVSIGSVAGSEAAIPSAVLRGKDTTLRGAGIGSWDVEALGDETPAMLDILRGASMPEVKAVSVKEAERVWNGSGAAGAGERLVFVFDEAYVTRYS